MQTAPVRPRRSPDDDDLARVELGRVRPRAAESRRGPRRRSRPPAGSARRVPGNPDLGHPKLAGASLARRDPVAELGGVEADCESRPCTATPATSPVEASTPEGMSAATTGAPQPLIASIAASAGARGAPEKPVPKIASTTTPEPASAPGASPAPTPAPSLRSAPGSTRESVDSSVGGPQEQRLDLVSRLRQVARRDQPVSSVVPLAAHDTHHPGAATSRAASATAAPAASISSRDGIPCCSIAQESAARIPAASKIGVSQSSIRGRVSDESTRGLGQHDRSGHLLGVRERHLQLEPARRRPGRPRAHGGEASAPRVRRPRPRSPARAGAPPSAFIAASLAANRAAR